MSGSVSRNPYASTTRRASITPAFVSRHGSIAELGPIKLGLRSSSPDQLTGRDLVLPEESVNGARGVVARSAGVDDEDAIPAAREKNGARQSGWTTADDD